MVFFIDFLKALAACLITNAHYTGIYPTDLIANGGLIGDIIFFAVSGWCLYSINDSFLIWYGKRLYRCYLSVTLITLLYIVLGFYSLEEHGVLWWFIYPTAYHFVTSIVLLYIPFYLVMKTELFRNRLPYVMLTVLGFALIWYFFIYDKSFYHIDNVREPMIRVLFFESMLLGAWFRQNDACLRGGVHLWHIPAAILSFAAYFGSKILFSRYPGFSEYQILNQFLIFTLLYFFFHIAVSFSSYLERLPNWFKSCVLFLPQMTLEIYVVQYVLIDLLRPAFGFPLNWFLLTGAILVSAFLLNRICDYLSLKRLMKLRKK